MPFPLVIAAVAGGIAAAGAIGAWIAYEALKDKAEGRKLVLVGPRQSGKTTLFDFMTSNARLDASKYSPTQSPNRTRLDEDALKKARWSELGFDVTDIDVTDMPGDREKWGSWYERSQKADLLCFVANAHEMRRDAEHADEARRAGQQVASWRSADTRKPQVILVISHTDLEAESSDDILRRDEIRALRMALKVKATDTLLANLLSNDDANRVGLHLLEALLSE